jgi:pyroglutamyl-peptidase
VVRLERVAVNCADFEIADNQGLLTREPVLEGGAAARLSTLPLADIRERLLDAGIPCRLSGSAGTFLCNALMYHTLDACAGREPPPPAGFVHLPYLPRQVAWLIRDTAEEARLELHQRGTMVEAVRIALETVLQSSANAFL